MPELFFATRGELKLTPVEWPTRQPSIAVLALRDGSLPLYRKEVGDDGKVMPVVAHRVQIPAGAKEVLLFGWLDKGELHLHAVEDNFLTAKHNDWLLINLSQKDIFFRVGEDTAPTRVDSGKSKFYRIDVDANKGTSVIGGANIRGKERLFYSTYLPIQEGERTIMLFSTDGDKIRTKPVYDKFKRRPE